MCLYHKGEFTINLVISISASKLTNVSKSAEFQLPESAASLDFPELDHVGHSFEVEGAISRSVVPYLSPSGRDFRRAQ